MMTSRETKDSRSRKYEFKIRFGMLLLLTAVLCLCRLSQTVWQNKRLPPIDVAERNGARLLTVSERVHLYLWKINLASSPPDKYADNLVDLVQDTVRSDSDFGQLSKSNVVLSTNSNERLEP
ncbi:hypothetical protein Pla52n_55080 [Stieleria varia]|uniref:Uncharacterized protein n=1 Tax=Stieleria varia TaxID=2528005 RepID=A0A5C6A8S3_9BACT|nr:hypothetical protein Pla52n_55080 [Stieleria varia]